MTAVENEVSNQTFKKPRAPKGFSNSPERNVAGSLNAGTPLTALGQLPILSFGNVAAQFAPLSSVCHGPEAKNTAMVIPSHSYPIRKSVEYPAPQMNSSWTSEHNFPNVNTQVSKISLPFGHTILNINMKELYLYFICHR